MSKVIDTPFDNAVVKPSSGNPSKGGCTYLDGDLKMELVIGVEAGAPSEDLLDWVGK